jgi:hypothetical protein
VQGALSAQVRAVTGANPEPMGAWHVLALVLYNTAACHSTHGGGHDAAVRAMCTAAEVALQALRPEDSLVRVLRRTCARLGVQVGV